MLKNGIYSQISIYSDTHTYSYIIWHDIINDMVLGSFRFNQDDDDIVIYECLIHPDLFKLTCVYIMIYKCLIHPGLFRLTMISWYMRARSYRFHQADDGIIIYGCFIHPCVIKLTMISWSMSVWLIHFDDDMMHRLLIHRYWIKQQWYHESII